MWRLAQAQRAVLGVLVALGSAGCTARVRCERASEVVNCSVKQWVAGWGVGAARADDVRGARIAEVARKGHVRQKGETPTYRVVLVTRGGAEVPLTPWSSSGTDDSKARVVEEVNRFVASGSAEPLEATLREGFLFGPLLAGALLLFVGLSVYVAAFRMRRAATGVARVGAALRGFPEGAAGSARPPSPVATAITSTPVLAGTGVRLFFAILFLGTGLALLALGAWTAHQQYTIIEKWPTVDAEVIRSELIHHWSSTGRSSGRTKVYEAEVTFRFVVAGRTYTSLSSSNYGSSNRVEMQARVDEHPVGSRHTIRYDPANPSRTSFDAGWTFGFFLFPLIFFGVGLACAGPGTLVLVGAMRGRRCLCCGRRAKKAEEVCPNCGGQVR